MTAPIDLAARCPRCGGLKGKIAPGKGPHAAALICAACGRFLQWISKADLAALAERDQVDTLNRGALS